MRRFKKAGIGLLLCLCICLCAGAVIFAVRRRDSGELEYSETEFRELLDENALLYEQNLRDAYSIPDDVSVKDCLGDPMMKNSPKKMKNISHAGGRSRSWRNSIVTSNL